MMMLIVIIKVLFRYSLSLTVKYTNLLRANCANHLQVSNSMKISQGGCYVEYLALCCKRCKDVGL